MFVVPSPTHSFLVGINWHSQLVLSESHKPSLHWDTGQHHLRLLSSPASPFGFLILTPTLDEAPEVLSLQLVLMEFCTEIQALQIINLNKLKLLK